MPGFLGCQAAHSQYAMLLGSLSSILFVTGLSKRLPFDDWLHLRIHRLASSRHRTSKFALALPCPVPAIVHCETAETSTALAHPLPAKLSSKLSIGGP